jgi:translation initiation factor 1
VVTLVLGLVGTEEQLADLAKVLKSACGTGGTVKEGVVELQGDHRQTAQAALAARGLKSAI